MSTMHASGTHSLVERQIGWASEYNAYERLARSPEELFRLIEPARAEWTDSGHVPSWCGVDLLRGWAFYLVRADRHGGGYSLEPNGSVVAEWRAVMNALATHRAAVPADRPPLV